MLVRVRPSSVVVQYSTVQCGSTVQYSTVQYSTVQYSTVQYSTCSNLGTWMLPRAKCQRLRAKCQRPWPRQVPCLRAKCRLGCSRSNLRKHARRVFANLREHARRVFANSRKHARRVFTNLCKRARRKHSKPIGKTSALVTRTALVIRTLE